MLLGSFVRAGRYTGVPAGVKPACKKRDGVA